MRRETVRWWKESNDTIRTTQRRQSSVSSSASLIISLLSLIVNLSSFIYFLLDFAFSLSLCTLLVKLTSLNDFKHLQFPILSFLCSILYSFINIFIHHWVEDKSSETFDWSHNSSWHFHHFQPTNVNNWHKLKHLNDDVDDYDVQMTSKKGAVTKMPKRLPERKENIQRDPFLCDKQRQQAVKCEN